MIAMLDVDQSGKLGLDEFLELMEDIAKWKAVFKLYDVDASGRLSAFELREALHSAGYKLNNRILNAIAHRYSSRDGMITLDDFIMCAVKIKTMMGSFRSQCLTPFPPFNVFHFFLRYRERAQNCSRHAMWTERTWSLSLSKIGWQRRCTRKSHSMHVRSQRFYLFNLCAFKCTHRIIDNSLTSNRSTKIQMFSIQQFECDRWSWDQTLYFLILFSIQYR